MLTLQHQGNFNNGFGLAFFFFKGVVPTHLGPKFRFVIVSFKR